MKERIVEKVLSDETLDRVILFASSKMKVKELAVTLKRKGLNVEAMHSDLDQREREITMLAFKNRHIRILIATDIVSRGIDIDDIQMVINFDVPRDPEDYVHRIGRTARANREGQAVTLVTPRDWQYLLKIERLIEKEVPKPDLPEGCGEKPDMGQASKGQRRRTPGRHGGKGRYNRRGSGKHHGKPKDKSPNNRQKA
jgi:superfamily II DNA/RNA helicase